MPQLNDSVGMESRLLESDEDSENESVLGTNYGTDEDIGPVQVPSLVDLCSRVIAENDELLPEMKSRSNLSLRDIWKSVKAKRDKDAEELRTKYTVSVKGNRDDKSRLPSALERRMHSCTMIMSLVLDDCKGLTDGILLGLCTKGRRRALPHLQHLSVTMCPGVSGASVVQIIKAYNVQLKTLQVSKSGVDHKVVKPLAKYCPEILVVNFSHMVTIRDEHLADLARGCQKLREIDVSYCKLVTDKGVGKLADLRHLEALNISYCSKVGNSVFQLRDCKFLQRLRLQDCPLVSDGILMPVLGCCSLLEVLCVRCCPLVTMASVQKIADCCTNMRVLDIVGIHANGNKALSLLSQSCFLRETLQEYMSSDRVVLRLTPHIWKLYNTSI